MSIYPTKVRERIRSTQHSEVVEGENAVGKDASFVCGSFVRFSIQIDDDAKMVSEIGFQTNGCGHMIAAADVLVEAVMDNELADLHGLRVNDLYGSVEYALGTFENSRSHCAETCIAALRNGFADYRSRKIEEFRGENVLICTCFGVTEDVIETLIAEKSLQTIDDVASVCNAGSGCGSCRMLIQEMLDTAIGSS